MFPGNFYASSVTEKPGEALMLLFPLSDAEGNKFKPDKGRLFFFFLIHKLLGRLVPSTNEPLNCRKKLLFSRM